MSVYFAEACGFTKIGYSKNPLARATTVTRLGIRPPEIPSGANAELIGWIPGNTWHEQELHAQHIADRVKGEWFRLDPDYVRDLIWDDPCGVDIQRMSAAAVFTMLNSPAGVTRDDVEAAGVPVLSVSIEEGVANLGAHLDAVMSAASARARAS